MVAVGTHNIDQLKGMPDVEFDFGVSSALRSAFSGAASQVSAQRSSRAAYRNSGLVDFEGHYSTLFRHNGTTQLGDLDEIVTNLRLVDTRVGELEEAARAENGRRKQAREWAERMDNRSGVKKFVDGLFGSEQPPVPNLEDTGPAKAVAAPPARTREPLESGGGSSAGRSSARPEELRSFATNTRGADDALQSRPGTLEGHCEQFTSRCRWATLDASSVISGLKQWLTANSLDAEWADTVAAAFERAGSDGGLATLSNSAISAALAAKGIAESRTDIQIDPPTAYGSPPTTGYSDDPVNTATGNFLENEIDLGFGGAGASLGFTRAYSSLNGDAGGFGTGWSSWTECELTFTDESARLILPDWRVEVF